MESLSVPAPEIWAVLAVETAGCGFLPDRRPPILFERHIFSRLTKGRFDICEVSNPQAGGYGGAGAHQFLRLDYAIQLDRPAALRSASWGLPQILGMNFAAAGFQDVESMIAAMCDSEDAQLDCFVRFLKNNRLDCALQAHDWTSFARGYNGPAFAAGRYDVRLDQAYRKFAAGPLPDLSVRAKQLYLTFAGYDPGPVDGIMGSRTQTALRMARQSDATGQFFSSITTASNG